ncbi:PKD domain-containing protein [Spongiimicrobium salis]|uniref:PKD domain-containing protein n=1 Tax=Spongiimicrobium salis TaxID=1667022 RepID=UPI00374DC46D
MKNTVIRTGRWFFVMMLLGTFFSSCDNEEEGLRADQSRDDIAPLSVSFDTSSMFLEVSTTNTSTNARTYAWDFGVEGTDDDTSIEVAPSYTYEVGGTYTITLTSRGDGGQEETFSSEITVDRERINPSASFTSETDFLDVTFINTSVNAVSHAWDFGDNNTSTDENPTHTYSEAGTYTVSLTVSSATDDTDTVTAEITVEAAAVAPSADFSVETMDLMATFTDASSANSGNITAYAWDFGDQMGTSTDQNPTYIYAAAGNFEVTLTITFDEVNGETTSSITQTVSVTAPTGGMNGPGTAGNQFAFITDTDGGDTGELRLNLDNTIAVGRMTAVIRKEASDLDAFVNLSGSSTTRRNAMIDIRIDDANGFEFTESGDNVATPNFPTFMNDEFVMVDITWDASGAGAPLVTVTIDGQAATAAPFESAGQDATAIADGVQTVQFRLGGNGDLDATGAGFWIDNLNVYDMTSGTPTLVFEDDYESYTVGDSLDPDEAADPNATPYRDNSFQVVVNEEAGAVGGPGTPGNQLALITDTDGGDTGELRLNLDNTIAVGRMTAVIRKEATSLDAFVNLSGSSTTRRNAMIDFRIDDANGYEFTESGDNVTMPNFPAFMNDEFVMVDITWDASGAGAPLVSVTIDGQAVTAAPFESAGQDATAIADGVQTVQFRLGGNGDLDASGAGFFIDELRVYDTSSGMGVLVFEDNFEGYATGESLDPDGVAPIVMNSPYANNSFQAVVTEE